ncbi:DUF6069 family protein [Actinoplanes subtropicus]|uniref:DUF6069 family protein n=1 Tax=Actinoplanes subtropicus TaxID=543632 RepID=UPI000556E0F9|nr:DUF6069 family protein [Actinoplanes subtropicus]
MTVTSRPAGSSVGRTIGSVALATVVAAVAAGLTTVVIALIARALGASHDFQPLQPASYLPLTVLGVLAGAIGWQVIRRRATRPAAVLRWLAPVVVALSLIPDIAVGAAGTSPGVSWGAVSALMLMHLTVAATAVLVYRRFMPVR